MSQRSGPRRPRRLGDGERAIGSAPRATRAPAPGSSPGPDFAAAARPEPLVEPLIRNFSEQIRRTLGVELDGSETSLAFVDHHLRLAKDEDREPIVTLLAAGSGAYFGDLVRRDLGAIWIGDGSDPRRLRLLMTSQLIHFSPVDQAFEAIAGHALSPDDPRLPVSGAPFDPAFHFTAGPDDADDDERRRDSDAAWLEARLAELPPVPEAEFHSLTCRFETLKLMLELLAAKHADEGKPPAQYGVEDYLSAFSGAG